MTSIEFDDSLLTGDPVVDEQHRMLIGMFNELRAAGRDARGPDAIGPLLERLHVYTVEHFTAEQKLMAKTRFPADEMLAHVEEHGELTQRVRQLIVDYRTGGMDTVLPVATLLQDWLAVHIQQRDCRLVEHIRLSSADGD